GQQRGAAACAHAAQEPGRLAQGTRSGGYGRGRSSGGVGSEGARETPRRDIAGKIHSRLQDSSVPRVPATSLRLHLGGNGSTSDPALQITQANLYQSLGRLGATREKRDAHHRFRNRP